MNPPDTGPLTRERAAEILRGGDPVAMAHALVAIALNEPDRRWVQAECTRLSTHADANLRRLSAVCIGHLGRLHGEVDRAAAESLLRRLAADPDAEVRGGVEDALGDLEVFLGWCPDVPVPPPA